MSEEKLPTETKAIPTEKSATAVPMAYRCKCGKEGYRFIDENNKYFVEVGYYCKECDPYGKIKEGKK